MFIISALIVGCNFNNINFAPIINQFDISYIPDLHYDITIILLNICYAEFSSSQSLIKDHWRCVLVSVSAGLSAFYYFLSQDISGLSYSGGR